MSLEFKAHHYERGLKRKAVDHVLWLNFKHRVSGEWFKLIETRQGNFIVEHSSFYEGGWGLYRHRIFRRSYKRMRYAHITELATDIEPLEHWEAIRGMISTQDGELLRYILKYKIPLDKFIRHELAARGFDEDNIWRGFKKAEEIWLK